MALLGKAWKVGWFELLADGRLTWFPSPDKRSNENRQDHMLHQFVDSCRFGKHSYLSPVLMANGADCVSAGATWVHFTEFAAVWLQWNMCQHHRVCPQGTLALSIANLSLTYHCQQLAMCIPSPCSSLALEPALADKSEVAVIQC